MDEDAKALKKLQDHLFEDEENDGVGRERKFRWKNNPEGFIMEDENACDIAENNQEEVQEENETQWRRMRHERDLIVEKTMKEENSQTISEILLMDHCSQTITMSNTLSLSKKKITIVRSSSTAENDSRDSQFFTAKMPKSQNSFLSSRGSFLLRDENTLEKIASLTKNSNENENVGNIVMGKGNFVFTTLSPVVNKSEAISNKRKSDSINDSESKKQKTNENSKKKIMLLDQLT